MHCSSCNEKGECWALCHQYSCTCIICIYILVLYLQNSSKASQAPSPWGGNGKWVFSAQYFCLETSGSKRRGSVFLPLKAKGRSWDQCFGSCRLISTMYHVETVLLVYRIDHRAALGSWGQGAPTGLSQIPLWSIQCGQEGRAESHLHVCKASLNLKSDMVSLCWILWQFTSQAKWRHKNQLISWQVPWHFRKPK